MQRMAKQSPLKIRGSMTMTGDLDEAVAELKKEREQSLERLVDKLKEPRQREKQKVS